MEQLFRPIENIEEELRLRAVPLITYWNRLEGSPRTNNFDKALQAKVCDALWMITRQWQMGEFKGDDAGSPIKAKIHMYTTRLNKYQAAGHEEEPFTDNVPLEAEVEKLSVPFFAENQEVSLDLRLAMGRRWQKLIRAFPEHIKEQYLKRYPVNEPDPDSKEDAYICSDVGQWQHFAAYAGRSMDGGKLYGYLKRDASNLVHDNISGLSPIQKVELEQKANQFLKWFDDFFLQPTEKDQNAWKPSYMEYQFKCAAPYTTDNRVVGEKKLSAEEYYHGKLDWFSVDSSFDRTSRLSKGETHQYPDIEKTITTSFLPTPVSFTGMPNTRWWAFEDRKANFGDINPDTTDLGKLLVIQFGLIYANDWFIFPVQLPVGSLAEVKGLTVTNTFNERIWIEPAGERGADDWSGWKMYALSRPGGRTSDRNSTILLPTAEVQEGLPLEKAIFIRDEMANMVWGIEQMIPLPNGKSKRGAEAGVELYNHYKKLLDKRINSGAIEPLEFDYKADIKYHLMSSVPMHWVPFIPVHVPGSDREIQLQRAGMPLIIEGDPEPPTKIVPRTFLLRQGRDEVLMKPLKIYEEEIPRAGIEVYRSFHKAAWYGGIRCLWLGMWKHTGRGEGSSGLVFDQIPEVKKTPIPQRNDIFDPPGDNGGGRIDRIEFGGGQ